MLRRLTIAGLAATSFTSVNAQEMPYPDTIIVLDVSNSMWGQIDGTAKIIIARKVIGDLVTNLTEDIDFGLVAYGHRTKADCADIQTIVPVGKLDPKAFKRAVNSLVPQGRTPLTAAVRMAANQLHYTTRSARIVLVSDGVESCNGNPAALAAELKANALDLTVHVIGFDVSGISDQSGLAALAKLNGGLYLTPDTSRELKDDLNTMMDMPAKNMTTSSMTSEPMAAATPATMAAPGLSAPDTVAPRSPIMVAVSGHMGSGDYIGLANDSGRVLAISRADSKGSAALIAPQASGRYELRYYSAQDEILVRQSLTVK